MLVRPPPLFGATIGILPPCFPRSVLVTKTTISAKTAATKVLGSPVNVVAAYHMRGPSQLRWQSQLLCRSMEALPQAQKITPVAAPVRLSGRKSSLVMRLVAIRLASTESPAAQKKQGGVVQASNGEQTQAQTQGQAQLPPTAANGVPQLKAPKLEYPERLLIYNAGKGKIIFIALLKLTTVLIFSAFGLFVAPAYIVNGSPLAGVAIFTCGLTPLLFLAHSSRPFVAQIHLTKLPPYARLSSDVLLRFARSLPPQSASRLEFVTMSLIGKPRVSSVSVADLKPVSSLPSFKNGWLKRVNFVRVDPQPTTPSTATTTATTTTTTTTTTTNPKTNNKKLSSTQWKIQQLQTQQQQLKEKKQQGWKQRIFSWARFKSVKEFYVTDVPQKTAEKRGVKEARVWEEIRGLIEKRAVREAERRMGGR
ncbi:hypothetical protein B0H65DRAFT_7052 [Neurospora tetraspora]|uniref:Uncharacterized protein n=1 Tax=Neurospora tetraspora TaxID=94610 RepID=A0AAE0JMM6_9PEZI|nr:hypothetical protein B0H65DRAFT_7052 [Neurospora tetraspora]